MIARHLARCALPVVVLVGCAGSGSPAAAPQPTIDVQGHLVSAAGVATVEDALAKAHVSVPHGSVLAVISRRPLAVDRRPGSVLVDGQPTSPESALRPGAVVTVVPGPDVTEPLRVVREAVPPQGGFASLYVGGRAGTSRVVVGAVSGETVSQELLVPPRMGHLIVPRAVALTFDDGPDPTWTPQVLALLAKAHVHATFCLIGREVAAHAALVRAIVAGGHRLCNHTWSHDEHLAGRSPEEITAQLARTQRAIEAATGITPVLFRAPGGNWAPDLVREAQRQGMAPLTWSVDPRDWSSPGLPAMLRVVLATLRPGAVVILHDGGGDRSQTLALTRLLLARLPALRYSVQLPQP